jgi:hypothetical protein
MDQPTSRNSNAGPESTEQLHPLGGPADCSATGNHRYWSRYQHLEPSFDCHWSLVASMQRKTWSMKASCSARCRALLYTSCSGRRSWWAVRVSLRGLPAQHRLRIAEMQILSMRAERERPRTSRTTSIRPRVSRETVQPGTEPDEGWRGLWITSPTRLGLLRPALPTSSTSRRSNSSMPGFVA